MADQKTLTIDIGGSGIKAMVLDTEGNPIGGRKRVSTPRPAKPDPVLDAIVKLAKKQSDFDRVSVGFPGVMRKGMTETAVNLHKDWIGFDLEGTLSKQLGKPVRALNDADIQGFGAISGKGVELVVTLGTGFGSALFLDGQLVPNLEIAHHLFHGGKTYEEHLGSAALKKSGRKKWQRRVMQAIASLEHLFNYDTLYIGGGNARRIALDLPPNVKIISNIAGLLGGIALWRD
jgi:polyphosphate glucokinase